MVLWTHGGQYVGSGMEDRWPSKVGQVDLVRYVINVADQGSGNRIQGLEGVWVSCQSR